MYVVEVSQYIQHGENDKEQIKVALGIFDELNYAEVVSKVFFKEKFDVVAKFDSHSLMKRNHFVFYSIDLREDISVVLTIIDKPINTLWRV